MKKNIVQSLKMSILHNLYLDNFFRSFGRLESDLIEFLHLQLPFLCLIKAKHDKNEVT